ELPEALFAETHILHFGSISLLGGTTPAGVLATVERLKDRALPSFDPNLRPSLVRDEHAYRALLDRLFVLADIVKLSTMDVAWLAPGQTAETLTEDVLARGPALVAITQGSRGVLSLRGGDRWLVPGFPVQVVDT